MAAAFSAGWGWADWHRDHSTGSFTRKQYCSEIAEQFRRAQLQSFTSDHDEFSVDLQHVAYSGTRNSCIAEVRTLHNPPDFEEDQVVDLLSKETLFSRVCNTPGRIPCDVDDSMEINAEKAFAKALVTQGELPINLR
jgi:hypothetical protein